MMESGEINRVSANGLTVVSGEEGRYKKSGAILPEENSGRKTDTMRNPARTPETMRGFNHPDVDNLNDKSG
jgi:hypothetical protein